MSNVFEGSGSCLCGAVSFSAKNIDKKVGACHCGMCRKWGGGPFLAVDCGADVTFENAENITVYSSSEWAERGFCNKCGTHLFCRMKESQQHYMPVGLFDNNDMFILENQIFIDKKPSFYSFANKTKDMTEAEVFAEYGAPE